jgi:DNA-binding NarL/FixJ family response regulator
VVGTLVGRRRTDSPIDELSAREREVIALMAEGRSNRGIADVLVVTVPAVERHVTSIFRKLSLTPASEDHRRVLAVLEYLQSPTYCGMRERAASCAARKTNRFGSGGSHEGVGGL